MAVKIISTSQGVLQGLSSAFRKNFSLNQNLITNIDVKKKYLNQISNFINGGNLKLIQRLVEKGKIIPVECTNDFIKKLNKDLDGDAGINPKKYANVLGFYTGRQNRIYILMDNIQKFFGVGGKELSDVTIHELQHMCCYNFIGEFIQTWQNELYNFYAYFTALVYKAFTSGFKSMWNTLSGKDRDIIAKLLNPDNGVKYLTQYMIYNFEYLYTCAGANISTSDCKAIGEKYGMVLINNGCDENTSNKICQKITKMAYDVFNGSIGSTYTHEDNATIINCFRQSYLRVFNRDPWKDGTLIYQELIFPSEIISITSQYFKQNSKYYKFLGKL